MSARSSCAPAPIRTAKRAPEILVARSKSMMPSSGPRSQCALGSKSKAASLAPGAHDRCCPRRTAPTARWRAAGSAASRESTARRRSTPSSSTSICLIFWPRCLLASKMCDASWPCRLARATSSPAVFCSRLRPSTCGISRRRCASSVASWSSSALASSPRDSRLCRTSSRWSRTKTGSSMI